QDREVGAAAGGDAPELLLLERGPGRTLAEHAERLLDGDTLLRMPAVRRNPARVLARDRGVEAGHHRDRLHGGVAPSGQHHALVEERLPQVRALDPLPPQAILRPA